MIAIAPSGALQTYPSSHGTPWEALTSQNVRRDDGPPPRLVVRPEHPAMPPCPGPLDAHRATVTSPAAFATPKTRWGWFKLRATLSGCRFGLRGQCFGLSRGWFGIAALRWRHCCCLIDKSSAGPLLCGFFALSATGAARPRKFNHNFVSS